MRVLNPFGPKIAVTKIPSKIINRINKEVDLITIATPIFPSLKNG